MATTVSKIGLATLNYLEGCPLKAYRDVAGVWTIGAGLTKASGVITPKAGMTITQAEADKLLQQALDRKYIPSVLNVMGRNQNQNVVDASVSFHFNTGAIAKASWVSEFKKGNFAGARAKLLLWKKAGGKVVAGLLRRREIEADILIKNVYPANVKASEVITAILYARFVVPVSDDDIKTIQDNFETLGYKVKAGDQLKIDPVKKFQKDNNLKVDGLIGTATLAMLERHMAARSKTQTGAIATAGGSAVGVGGDVTSGLDGWGTMVGVSVTVIGLIYIAYLAYTYRDVIAEKIKGFAPNLAAKLRSF